MFPFRDRADDVDDVLDVEAYVRQRTGHAGIAAGLLIFFGFFWFGGATGSGAFYVGDVLFHCALRFGGLAMVGVAIWMSIGLRSALIGEGILSTLIGLLMAAGGILMAIAAGQGFTYIQYFIYLVCGITFLVNGLRTLHDYMQLARLDVADDENDLEGLATTKDSGSRSSGVEVDVADRPKGRPAAGQRRKDSQSSSPPPGSFVRLSEEQQQRRR